MKSDEGNRKRVAVIGGGIAGLAAAQRLNVLRPEWTVELFESQDRLGGVIKTEHHAGYLIEHAADNFLRGPTAPWGEALCQEIGFADQLISTSESHRGAHVVWQGRLHPVPAGFQLMAPGRMWPIIMSSLLSVKGKLRLALEPFIRPSGHGSTGVADETLKEFATRRLGQECFERLVQPLVAGIYTADPDQLSVAAALPQMVRMEQEHGSLYRAMRQRRRDEQNASARQTRGARYSLFVAPRGGMSDLVSALAGSLHRTTVRLECPVVGLSRDDTNHWKLTFGDDTPSERFDGVIVALPTHRAAKLLQITVPAAAAEIAAIPLASSSVVCLGLANQQLKRPLTAFGCVVPAAEQRRILAISYSSLKFPGRAPPGRVLLRVFVGGALQPQLADLDDDSLLSLAMEEVDEVLGLDGQPELTRIVRWPQAMPQYHVGHLDRVRRIEQVVASCPGLQLAGSGYRGVGIPQCIRSGRLAAEALTDGVTSD